MKRWLARARDLVFPQVRCLGCDEPRAIDPGAALCVRCVKALEKLRLDDKVCPRCLCFVRFNEPCQYCVQGKMGHLTGSWAPYRYSDVSQRLVVLFKFSSVFQARDLLIDAMLASMPASGFDALVPIPLHANRRRQRGFDQAALLAQGVAEKSGLPVRQALFRYRKTPPQSSLSHHKRQADMENTFRVILPVKGQRILLVDDVRTTGSTARSCAEELMAAGAMSVGLLTATVAAGYGLSLPSQTRP